MKFRAFILSMIIGCLLCFEAGTVVAATNVSLVLNTNSSVVGGSVTGSGTADANTSVSIKVLDTNDSVVFFDAVKSDANGNYSDTFTVPSVSPETLTVVAGYGSNVANANLTIGSNASTGPTSQPPADNQAPTWPTSSTLTVSNVTQTSLTLTWTAATDNTAVTGYKIYQGTTLLGSVDNSTLTYNVTGLIAGTNYTFSVKAGDAAGNGSTDGPTVSETTAVPITTATVTVAADGSNKSLSVTSATVALATPVTVTVPSSVTDATIDLSSLLNAPVSGTVTTSALPAMTITANTSLSATPVQVSIPAGTTINADASWGGSLNVPSVIANNNVTVTPDSGDTATVNAVVEVGFGDVPLTLSAPVRILLPGEAGKNVGYVRGTTFTKITNVLTQDSGDSLLAGGDGYLNVGSDLVIWTRHFTEFVAYTQTPIFSGGGVSSSDTQPPQWPASASVSVSKNVGIVTLNWPAATDNVGVTAYKIYEDSTSSAPLATVSGNTLTYTYNEGTVAGTDTYYVKAGDAAGNWSTTIVGTLITGQSPLDFYASQSYLVTVSGSTANNIGPIAGNTNVPVMPTIMLYFDRGVTNTTVWNGNQSCITLQDSTGANVPITTSWLTNQPGTVYVHDIFLTPVSNLTPGKMYTITISKNLTANNNHTLGESDGNMDQKVTFTVAPDNQVPGTTPTTTTVATTLAVSGPTAVTIPASSTTANYTATVKDQNGNPMNGETVTWSLKAPVTGVTVAPATGVVTIDKSGSAGTFTVVATDGSVTGNETVSLTTTLITPSPVPSTPTAVALGGDNTIYNQTSLATLALATSVQAQNAQLSANAPAVDQTVTTPTTLTATDGVKVVVPPGAVSDQTSPVQITVAMGTVTTPPKAEPTAVVLDPLKYERQFGVKGQTDGSVQFTSPVTITFPVATADLPTGTVPQQLAVYWWDSARNDWVKLGGVFDPASNSISVTTYHFSTYAVMADTSSTPNRLSGSDRFATANAVADQGWKAGADNVVLANAYTFPDALAAGPLAYKLDAPILLTDADTLTPSTLAEIQKLAPKTITLIGGTAVISQAIQDSLSATYGTANVLRYGGVDRNATAVAIAAALGTTGEAVIANGEDGHYADALAVSSYAAYNGIPILFTETAGLPAVTTQALATEKVSSTIVVGGEAVIPAASYNLLPGATRYSGSDRYETATTIATGLHYNLTRVYVVNGLNFPDALVAGNLAAHSLSPIIMVDEEMPTATSNFFLANKAAIAGLTEVGGEAAITPVQDSALRSVILATGSSNTGSGSDASTSGLVSGSGSGTGAGSNSRAAEMVAFDPAATIISDQDSTNQYRYNALVDYKNVKLAWYFSFGFFNPLVDDLKNYVKFYRKDTGEAVVLPNIVTHPIDSDGYMEVTDWWFKRIPGRAPLGLTLVSTTLQPSTTYVIEIDAGFNFNNGDKTTKTYSFEFTTTPQS